MNQVASALQEFKASLCKEVDVGELYARNPVAHKWKAPWRALLLRESVGWRLQDLLEQSLFLGGANHLLGARIILRAAFETLAVLIYLNKAMRGVVAETLPYPDFSTKTTRLLLGSRDKTTNLESINIISVLQSANTRYPGLESWYAALSESAHPNYEGMLHGYSTADPKNYLTSFANQWTYRYGSTHEDAVLACLVVFEGEYNEEWKDAMEKLEAWIVSNNSKLEASNSPAA